MVDSPEAECPLVLIHGLSASAYSWAPIVPLLSTTRSVIVVNLPGHRDGPPLTNPRRFATSVYVDVVEAELDRLGIERADIVGNSLGGWIALQLAGRGRANSVVCLAPAGGWRVGGLYDRWMAIQFGVAARIARWLLASDRFDAERRRAARLFLLGMVAKPRHVSDTQLGHFLRDVAECEALAVSVKRAAGRDVSRVPAATCPVLIAWSERDRILISARARRNLERQVGSPQVVQLAGVGHVPMTDAPDLVAATILGFTEAAGSLEVTVGGEVAS